MTHFIDGSAIYGVDEKTVSEVRSFQGGRLRMLDDFGRQLLPLTLDKNTCVTLDKGPCFFAGMKYHVYIIITFQITYFGCHNNVCELVFFFVSFFIELLNR